MGRELEKRIARNTVATSTQRLAAKVEGMATPEALRAKPSARMDLLEANAQRSQELKADARAEEALPRREIK